MWCVFEWTYIVKTEQFILVPSRLMGIKGIPFVLVPRIGKATSAVPLSIYEILESVPQRKPYLGYLAAYSQKDQTCWNTGLDGLT